MSSPPGYCVDPLSVWEGPGTYTLEGRSFTDDGCTTPDGGTPDTWSQYVNQDYYDNHMSCTSKWCEKLVEKLPDVCSSFYTTIELRNGSCTGSVVSGPWSACEGTYRYVGQCWKHSTQDWWYYVTAVKCYYDDSCVEPPPDGVDCSGCTPP